MLKNKKKPEKGFTLIEIVIVLVLLGILTAVAAGKYFDLKEKAERDAAQAAADAFCSEVNMTVAKKLLENGGSCKDLMWGSSGSVREVFANWENDFKSGKVDFYMAGVTFLGGNNGTGATTKLDSTFLVTSRSGGSFNVVSHIMSCTTDKTPVN